MDSCLDYASMRDVLDSGPLRSEAHSVKNMLMLHHPIGLQLIRQNVHFLPFFLTLLTFCYVYYRLSRFSCLLLVFLPILPLHCFSGLQGIIDEVRTRTEKEVKKDMWDVGCMYVDVEKESSSTILYYGKYR